MAEESISHMLSGGYKSTKQVVTMLENLRFRNAAEIDRALHWRMCLGVLPVPSDSENVVPGFVETLKVSVGKYFALKKKVMPSQDKVEADPLSALGLDDADGNGDAWKAFEKNEELKEFILGDLDRLYLTGIDDEYFMEGNRKERILSILLLWSNIHKDVSYRQGMHEIAAPIFYTLERELEALQSKHASSPYAVCCNNDDSLEAHCYWMFEAVMKDILPLYDPTPRKKGTENQPQIVHFVTAMQEKFLKNFDPALCEHLDNNYVYPQVYGMRWSRLLFGREFPMTHTQSFRIWDYMFASLCTNTRENNKQTGRYGTYSPIMQEIGDVMLAMMLNMRSELIAGDGNETLGLLMHYPTMPDVTPILHVADSIGKGMYSHPRESNANAQPPHTSTEDMFDDTDNGAAGNSNSKSAVEPENKALPSWMAPSTASKASEQAAAAVSSQAHSISKASMERGNIDNYVSPVAYNGMPKMKIVPKANLDGDLGLKDTVQVSSSRLDDLLGDSNAEYVRDHCELSMVVTMYHD